MKKIFSILAIAALMAGCSKEDSTTDVAPATFTLTGYTSNDTRTAFGEPDWDNNKIPFIWSEGDKIWSGSEQSTEATINSDGSASFTFESEPESTIYYNMTGTSATEAYVPATQSIAENLGENGDFGYATVEDGKFTLEHATAYLGFIPLLIDDSDPDKWDNMTDAKIVSITIDAADGVIAGKANWDNEDECFDPATEGSSKIKLNINEMPDYEFETLTYYTAVILPSDLTGKTIKFTYELNIGGATKYFTATRAGKELIGGVTYEIVDDIVLSKLTDYRELRVLTFEDSDKKFSPYNIDGYEINTWSDLIVGEDEQAYMGSQLIYGSEYWWEDTDNTGLYHKFPYVYDTYAIMGGGYAISSHTGTLDDLSAAGDIYEYQLSIPLIGGHSGENFAVGFHDSSVDYNKDILPSLEFRDNTARVVDHMWVTNTSVTLYSMTYGNFVADAYKDGDYLNIVAMGYDGDTPTGEVRFNLAKDADYKVTEWTKWDLSSLGKVTKIIFRMEENTEGLTYGTWYDTPMYFAFDDVAVQF